LEEGGWRREVGGGRLEEGGVGDGGRREVGGGGGRWKIGGRGTTRRTVSMSSSGHGSCGERDEGIPCGILLYLYAYNEYTVILMRAYLR
jgi:hypothetical protein